MKRLEQIRKPNRQTSDTAKRIHSLAIAAAGLCLGIVIKLLDICTTNLGNIFSRLSIWILLCAAIAVFSSTPKRAGINVLLFCVTMIGAYYLTADFTNSVYSRNFVFGWTAFSLCSPFFAYFTWYAKGSGWIPRLLTAGIILVMLVSTAVLFDQIRISDWSIAVFTAVMLLTRRKERKREKAAECGREHFSE